MLCFIIKETILKSLKKEGIPSAIYYPKLISDQKAYFNSLIFQSQKNIKIFSIPFSPIYQKRLQKNCKNNFKNNT